MFFIIWLSHFVASVCLPTAYLQITQNAQYDICCSSYPFLLYSNYITYKINNLIYNNRTVYVWPDNFKHRKKQVFFFLIAVIFSPNSFYLSIRKNFWGKWTNPSRFNGQVPLNRKDIVTSSQITWTGLDNSAPMGRRCLISEIFPITCYE